MNTELITDIAKRTYSDKELQNAFIDGANTEEEIYDAFHMQSLMIHNRSLIEKAENLFRSNLEYLKAKGLLQEGYENQIEDLVEKFKTEMR